MTTTDSMRGRGPRCSRCAEFVPVATYDANNKLVCDECRTGGPNGFIKVLPRGRVDDSMDEDTV